MLKWSNPSADPTNASGEPVEDRTALAELDDLVTLAALACRTPVALIATFEDGELATLRSYGLSDDAALGATALVTAVAAGDGLVEIDDLWPGNAHFEPAEELLAFRWACGLPIPAPGGGLLAVVAVVDMRKRELTGTAQTGLLAVSRRIQHCLMSRAEPPEAQNVIDLTRRPERDVNPSQVLRCAEVAEIFAVSERTVMKWAADGRIPSFRTAGNRLRFRHDEIAAFVDGRSRSTIDSRS